MTSENGNVLATMPMAPVGYGYGGGMGNGWGNDIWLIIIILFALGGFGGFGMGGGYGMGGYGALGGMLYPWMNQTDVTTSGFQNAALSGQLNGIQTGVQNLSTQICNSSAGITQAITNGFANAEVADNARQIANMQTAFANQTAMNQGFNGVQSQLASCCCEQRLGLANLGADIAREACSDRQAVSDGVRDLLANQNQGIQRILDQMCNDKLDAKNERIADLERQLTMANLAASQSAQTATLLANNEAQTTALEQYLAPVPKPAYIVQNPSCCNQSYGCGCGCGM